MGQRDVTADHDWTERDENNLRELCDCCMPASIIAVKFGCSEAAVVAKASELGVGVARYYRGI